MLIESAAYASRWRRISPGAKTGFALAGIVAAFLAATPPLALAVALFYAMLSVLATGAPLAIWLRVASWPLAFLALGSLSLLVSITPAETGSSGFASWQWAPDAGERIAALTARSFAALSALLFLILSTPMSDLIGVMRRLRCPSVLLDLMLLAYRMLFVLSAAVDDVLAAQRARLGHTGWRASLRASAALAAGLVIQLWQRAEALHQAALARNGDGPLRVLGTHCPTARRDLILAMLASLLLLSIVGGLA